MQASLACISFFFKRDRLYSFLEPDILTLKCYIVNKEKFQNNLENIDIPLFANKAHSLNTTQCLPLKNVIVHLICSKSLPTSEALVH